MRHPVINYTNDGYWIRETVKSQKFDSLDFSCTPCILEAKMPLKTYGVGSKSCLETFLVSFIFFVIFTVFELFRKNWFGATNFENSWNCGLKVEHGLKDSQRQNCL